DHRACTGWSCATPSASSSTPHRVAAPANSRRHQLRSTRCFTRANENYPMSSSQYRCNDPADLAATMAIENKLAQYNPMDDIIDYYADDAIVLDVYAPGIFRGRSEIYAGFEEGLQT